MGYIIRTDDGDNVRHEMRRSMRMGGYHSPMMRGGGESWEHGYRMGYKHGWEDHEDEWDDMEMRRSRDSRGRYV